MNFIAFTTAFDSFLFKISKLLAYVAGYLLFFLMFLVTVHVFFRYFFDFPIPGAVELIKFTMVFVVFLGFGYGVYKGANVSVELIMERLPERVQFYVAILMDILGLIIISFIIRQNYLQILELQQSNQVSGVLHIPHWPLYTILLLGFVVFNIALLNHLLQSFAGTIKK